MDIAFESIHHALLAANRRDSFDGSSAEPNRANDRDRALVELVRDGDERSFEALVGHYVDPVTRFAIHLLGTRDTAEDVVQHAFVQIWRQRTALDPERSFRSYLFRAVRNRALDELATERVRNEHRVRVIAEAAADGGSGTATDPEEDALSETDLQIAIGRLPTRRQTAIRLRYENGLSHAEIGDVMGISPPAAMQLVLRGLADLKRILRV